MIYLLVQLAWAGCGVSEPYEDHNCNGVPFPAEPRVALEDPSCGYFATLDARYTSQDTWWGYPTYGCRFPVLDADGDGDGLSTTVMIQYDETGAIERLIPLDCDLCPGRFDPGQEDEDCDGFGDVCDNCPNVVNEDQANTDGDGYGDLCDNCPLKYGPQDDQDGDGRGDVCDNCLSDFNPDQADRDGDLRGDECDNCPDDLNRDQLDLDADGIGDVCDPCPRVPGLGGPDEDADGVGSECDNCPITPNPSQADLDQDGTGDACQGVRVGCLQGYSGGGCAPGPTPGLALFGLAGLGWGRRRRGTTASPPRHPRRG